MPDKTEQIGIESELYTVQGETVPLWLPLCFALIGVISSVLMAQTLLVGDFSASPRAAGKSYSGEVRQAVGDLVTTLPQAQPAERASEPAIQVDTAVAEPTDKEIAGKLAGKKTAQEADTLTQEDGTVARVKAETEANNEHTGLSNLELPADDVAAVPPEQTREAPVLKKCEPLFYFSFAIGSDAPDAHNLSLKIERLRVWLEQQPNNKLIVEGHADASGPDEFNFLLSYRRAKAAEAILAEAGISKAQLIVRAYGEHEPLPGQPAHSKKNRRAAVSMESLDACSIAL